MIAENEFYEKLKSDLKECKPPSMDEVTLTQPGTLTYALFGEQPSPQSVSIKAGKWFEKFSILVFGKYSNMILLDTGVVEIFTGKKKDIDISFIDEENKIIYYYEEKGNIEFDTEKLPATIHKIKLIKRYFKGKYPDYKIECGVFCNSIFSIDDIKDKNKRSRINKFVKSNIPVIGWKTFWDYCDIEIIKEDHYDLTKYAGELITQ